MRGEALQVDRYQSPALQRTEFGNLDGFCSAHSVFFNKVNV